MLKLNVIAVYKTLLLDMRNCFKYDYTGIKRNVRNSLRKVD